MKIVMLYRTAPDVIHAFDLIVLAPYEYSNEYRTVRVDVNVTRIDERLKASAMDPEIVPL
jgi:hypothetical protein